VPLAATFMLPCTACDRKTAASPPPPPPVTVARPVVREVTDWDVYTGRLAAPEAVDVRARVSGYIESAPFNEGSIVKQGDLLFVIDPRPYQAELAAAQAEVQRAEAQQRYAQSEFERVSGLRRTGALTELEFFQSRQNAEAGAAALAAAKARVETAQLNMEWTRVTAPIGGRVGRRLVTQGNLITGGTTGATLLTTITATDPVYCYIDVDEHNVRRYQELVRAGTRVSARREKIPAQLALLDEPDFSHQGVIDFVDNRIDPGTGTIVARGVFPNPTQELLPGFFARMRIHARQPYRAMLVPEVAVSTNLSQQFVLTVDANDVVQYRTVRGGNVYGNLRAIEGIEPDARVIINGMANARPGGKVKPQEVTIQAPTTQSSTTQPTPTTGPAPAESGQLQANTPSNAAPSAGSPASGATGPTGTPAAQGSAQPGAQPGSLGQGPSRSNNGPAAQGGGQGSGGPGGGGAGGGGAGGAVGPPSSAGGAAGAGGGGAR
jgi:RND family efflux transporter MFP subunit